MLIDVDGKAKAPKIKGDADIDVDGKVKGPKFGFGFGGKKGC